MKLWQKNTDSLKEIEQFTVGRDREFDMMLAPFDVLGSIAHVTMLETVDLLAPAEKDLLVMELRGIYRQIMQSAFTIQPDVEDIHSQVE
jgi:argininosuccinate lyase